MGNVIQFLIANCDPVRKFKNSIRDSSALESCLLLINRMQSSYQFNCRGGSKYGGALLYSF